MPEEKSLEEVISKCLEEIASGEKTAADCLAEYPLYASQLKDWLEAAQELRLLAVAASPTAADVGRSRFLAQASASRPSSQSRRWLSTPRRWAFASAALGAAAAAIAALALVGGNGAPSAIVQPSSSSVNVWDNVPEFPRAEAKLRQLEEQLAQGSVETSLLREVGANTSNMMIVLSSSPLPAADVQRAATLTARQQEVLTEAKNRGAIAPEAAADLEQALTVTEISHNRAIKSVVALGSPITPLASPTSKTPVPTATPNP